MQKSVYNRYIFFINVNMIRNIVKLCSLHINDNKKKFQCPSGHIWNGKISQSWLLIFKYIKYIYVKMKRAIKKLIKIVDVH